MMNISLRPLHTFFPKLWNESKVFLWLLSPLALIYSSVIIVRKLYYYCKPAQKMQHHSLYNISVVGNLTSGGNHKTPMILHLAQHYLQQGKNVAIISRGYGREIKENKKNSNFLKLDESVIYQSLSTACELYGDEPVMIFNRLQQNRLQQIYNITNFQIWVGSNRKQLVQRILQEFPDVQEIISDDGLQHYALYRDVNYVMYRDEKNQYVLPMGPFREPKLLRHVPMNRKTKTHYVDLNKEVTLKALFWKQAHHNHVIHILPTIPTKAKFHVIAGIAKPQRFFKTLNDDYHIPIENQIHYDLADHQSFSDEWLHNFYEDVKTYVLMTEKDYVKCHDFLIKNPKYATITYYLVMELHIF